MQTCYRLADTSKIHRSRTSLYASPWACLFLSDMSWSLSLADTVLPAFGIRSLVSTCSAGTLFGGLVSTLGTQHMYYTFHCILHNTAV